MATRVTAVRIIAVDLTELLGLFVPEAEEGETRGWRRRMVWWVARDKKKGGDSEFTEDKFERQIWTYDHIVLYRKDRT